MEIEIHHFANTPVVTVSSKNHFCSLQLVYESTYPLKLHVLPVQNAALLGNGVIAGAIREINTGGRWALNPGC